MNRFALILLSLFAFTASAQAELVLRQATASQSVVIGPFVDSTDGNTAETGLTISNTDVRISINGGNITGKNSGGCTHDELGYYTCTFDATDTATVGRMQVMVHESGALPVYHEFQVVEEAVYDSCCASSAAPLTASAVWSNGTRTLTALDEDDTAIDLNATAIGSIASGGISSSSFASGAITATSIASGAITNAKFASGAIDATAIAANAIGASELASDAVTEIQTGLATASALTTVGNNVTAILEDTGTTLPATLSTIAGYIDTEIASLLDGVNVTHQTGIEICGSGTEADPWGACEE